MTQTIQPADLLRDIDDYQRRIEVLERVSATLGTSGGGMDFKGEVANFAALPSTPADGDIWQTNDTNHLWAWSGTAWVDLGPAGPPGPTGPTGAPGTPGSVEVYEQPGTPAGGGIGALWIDTDEPDPAPAVLAPAPLVTTLPGSPDNGDEVYLSLKTGGMVHLRYNGTSWDGVSGGARYRASAGSIGALSASDHVAVGYHAQGIYLRGRPCTLRLSAGFLQAGDGAPTYGIWLVGWAKPVGGTEIEVGRMYGVFVGSYEYRYNGSPQATFPWTPPSAGEWQFKFTISLDAPAVSGQQSAGPYTLTLEEES